MDLNNRVQKLIPILKGQAKRDAIKALESNDERLMEATIIRAWHITWLGFEPETGEPKQLKLIGEPDGLP